MNSSSVEFESYPVSRGIISDEDFTTSNYVCAYVMLLVCLVGVVTNGINIRTFIAMGLKDGVTVSLLGLAISDFGFTFFGCVLGLANILQVVEERHNLRTLPIQPKYVFGMFSAHLGFMFYQVTCMTTTFMAIARCMCVALPFKFKDYFTKNKSVIVLVLFNLIAAATYAPILSSMGVQRKFDRVVNRSRFVVWMSSKRSDVKDATTFIHFVVIVLVSSTVVAFCIVVMAKHLRQSVKFRNLSTRTGGNDVTEKTDNNKLSGKELQVLRQVIVICIIYTLSMVPTIFIAVYRLADDEFDYGKRLHNLYFTISICCTILEQVNSASTFLVYYAYNSKFRALSFSCLSRTTK